jgi:pyroglutamyl-peptidase
MPITLLLTGFGPFPGAPVNPTGPLVRALAGRRIRGLAGVRCVVHVFETSYAAVDRDLPSLLARVRPVALLMFGLARTAHHIRIETKARNALSTAVRDVRGRRPSAHVIAPDAAPDRPLRVPAARLLAAARLAGLRSALSRDAGSYLCNYLCWRASEAADRDGSPRLIAFVHVPRVPPRAARRSVGGKVPPGKRSMRVPATFGDLLLAGETIMRVALRSTAARIHR